MRSTPYPFHVFISDLKEGRKSYFVRRVFLNDTFSVDCNSTMGNRWYVIVRNKEQKLLSIENTLTIKSLGRKHTGKYLCYDIALMRIIKTILLKVYGEDDCLAKL